MAKTNTPPAISENPAILAIRSLSAPVSASVPVADVDVVEPKEPMVAGLVELVVPIELVDPPVPDDGVVVACDEVLVVP